MSHDVTWVSHGWQVIRVKQFDSCEVGTRVERPAMQVGLQELGKVACPNRLIN